MRMKYTVLFCCVLLWSTPGVAGDEVLLPVPTQSVYPGQSLSEAQLSMKLFSVSPTARQSYVFELHQLVRMEASRTLAAGKPIALQSLRTIDDVKKGQPTKATYLSGSVEIQGILLPLTSGSAGQTIEARNATSREIVKALVTVDGTLVVERR